MKINKKILTIIITTIFVYYIIDIITNLTYSEQIIQEQFDENVQYTSNVTLVIIDNIIEYNQFPKFPTGCECASLFILLQHYNIDVTIEEIIDTLPKGSIPKYSGKIMYGANPEKEFVGEPRSYKSFGVYNQPIAQISNKFKKGAIAKNDVCIEELKNILLNGNPVIAWVSIYEDFREVDYYGPWYDYSTGEKIWWLRGEHAVVVYGYDKDKIYISNPYNGKKYSISQKIFEYNYCNYGKRIVYYKSLE